MIHSLLSLAALILGLSLVRSWFSLPGAGLLAGLIWLWLCVPFFTRRPIIQGLRAELMIDFSFILAGIIGLLMKIF